MGQTIAKPVKKAGENDSRIVLSPHAMPIESEIEMWNDQSRYLTEFSVSPRKLTVDRPATWTRYRLSLSENSPTTIGASKNCCVRLPNDKTCSNIDGNLFACKENSIWNLKLDLSATNVGGGEITIGNSVCYQRSLVDRGMLVLDPICSMCDRPTSYCSQFVGFHCIPLNEPLCQPCEEILQAPKKIPNGISPNPEINEMSQAYIYYTSMTNIRECLAALVTRANGLKCLDCGDDENHWPIHPCDYVQCLKCAKIICPFCALEKHRDHKISSIVATIEKRKRLIWDSWKKIRLLMSKFETEMESLSKELNASLTYFSRLKDQLKEGIDEYEQAKMKTSSDEIRVREFVRNFDNGKSMNENKSMVSAFVANVENFSAVQQKWDANWFDNCKNVETIKGLTSEWKALEQIEKSKENQKINEV